ncbi:hypothetical protein [Azospirillum argentinense]
MSLESQYRIVQMRTAARIVADARGGPMRRIINGRHRKPTGRYSSAKAHRALPWEDKRERAYFWHCEADANVVAYLAQPHRLEVNVGRPRPLIYFPDLRRDMADGRVEIYEIKKAYNPDDDEDYDLKLRLAAEVYEGIGWSFRIIEAPEIERRPTLDTAWSVQRYRHVAITERDRFDVGAVLEQRGGTAPFQEIADVLGGGAIGMARLCASIVRRIVSIDITVPLDIATPVTLPVTPGGGLSPCT